MIDGRPYVINDEMDSIPTATGSKDVVVFGDLSKYVVKQVMSVQVFRMNEVHIRNGQISFVAFARSGGNLVDAGTHPVVKLRVAKS